MELTNVPEPPHREVLSERMPDQQTGRERSTGRFSLNWIRWHQRIAARLARTPCVIGTLRLTAQAAAIGATALLLPPLDAGLYRITYALRVTVGASSSSSLAVTLGWTDGGVAVTLAGAAVTLNTTAASQSGTVLVRVDQGTTLTYATAYASSGGTAMVYAFDVVIEAVPG